MVLAKSLSSLADTQMINKLDHAKSEREKKEEIKKKTEGEKEKEWTRKNKIQRKEEKLKGHKKERERREEREGKKWRDEKREGRKTGRKTKMEEEDTLWIWNIQHNLQLEPRITQNIMGHQYWTTNQTEEKCNITVLEGWDGERTIKKFQSISSINTTKCA